MSPSSLLNFRIISFSSKTSAEQEDFDVNHLLFHRPSAASTKDSAESIATPPPDTDLDDEQIRALLASPLHLQEREGNAGRSQVYHSERESLMSRGRPVALFSSKNTSNPVTFSDSEDNS